MSTSSDDPNTPAPKSELGSTEQPLTEKTTKPTGGLRGQAALLAGALAAVSGAQAAAAVPAAEPDRAYLEALLQGSWTLPPDLNARRLPPGTDADTVQLADELGASFNDSNNPNPTPYHDKGYGDSAFGDRRD